MKYIQHFSTRVTPQSEPIPGSNQVQNNAGGFSWQVTDWKQLDRLLLIGSEGGTYYVDEHKLTKDNAEAALRCIKADGKRVVDRVVEISEAGRAPKNDPALFVLAMCAGLGDNTTRKYALNMLSRVARIGTHLFHFNDMVQAFRGWGRGLREANAKWYNDRDPNKLAYQLIKYRQRDGWSHQDVLRLAHPKPPTEQHKALYRWVTKSDTEGLSELVQNFVKLQAAETENDVLSILSSNKSLTWEMVPTQFLGSAKVWDALLSNMMLTAMIRNLARMTANGLLVPMSDAVTHVVNQITDADILKEARVHPIAILIALKTYQSGHGLRGSLKWEPVGKIVDALDEAFYKTFGNVQPTGKRLLLGLDTSGSMSSENLCVQGVPGLTPVVAAGAMALITAATESNYVMVGFDTDVHELSISSRKRLDDVVRELLKHGGGTDCSLPMQYAMNKKLNVDAIVTWTDSETWYGRIHPAQAMREYREKFNQNAKMITVAMVANCMTIEDPNDFNALNIAGFDAATPQLINDFIKGALD